MRYVVWTLAGIGIAAAIASALMRTEGFSARAEPTMPERVIARAARRFAVPRGARETRNPVPFSPEAWS